MKDIALELLERTIQQGADAVGSYLQRVIKHPVIIVGCAGIEHYPNHGKLIREPYLDFIRR